MVRSWQTLRRATCVGFVACLLAPQLAEAHWCSNIFVAPSRLVVRPERDTVHLSGSGATELRVYLRNNFPYRLFNVRMRGNAGGYSVQVSPANQPIHPGQTAVYVLSITPDDGGSVDVPVTNLDLQVQFRFGGWQSESTCHVDENPGDTLLREVATWDNRVTICDRTHGSQSSALAAATMADQHPTTSLGSGAPFFGRTGIQQLIHWFGYRFCYNTGGSWRSLGQDCPSPQPEGSAWPSTVQFPQNCMRAGVELAERKPSLSSGDLNAARQAAINALTPGGSGEHQCIAAVVGGHLWSNAASPSTFASTLSDEANAVSPACQAAGRRALDDGSDGSNCTSGQYYERAACAAAEGLRDNDGPVTNVLMANAGDGIDGLAGYPGLYHSYLLKLVVADREQRHGRVSFYPDHGGPTPDASVPRPDSGGPTPDTGVAPRDDAGRITDAGVITRDGASPRDQTPRIAEPHRLVGGCGMDPQALAQGPALGFALVLLFIAGCLLGGRTRRLASRTHRDAASKFRHG